MLKQSAVIVLFAFVCSVSWAKSFEITVPSDNDINSKIGPKECAQGSKYWCQDLRTAKRCGAVKHCIQVVWENKKLAADNNEICETCKKMVEEARDELKSNTSQELIKEVLEGTCSIYFPIKILANECIKMVDEFIPEFIEILASRMDPQTVCSVAWLCNSNKIRDLVNDVKIVSGGKIKRPTFIQGFSSSSDECQDCKTFAVEAIQKVKTMGEGEFANRMVQFCEKFSGPMYTFCKMAAKSESSNMYNYIVNNLTPDEVCALTAMCVDGLNQPVNKTPKPKNPVVKIQKANASPECDMCVQLATRLREIIVANSSREEVKDALLNICGHLKVYKDQCTEYITNYFDQVYDFIIDEMNPQLLCQIFGLCVTEKRLIGQDEKASYGKVDSNQIPNVSVVYPFSKPDTVLAQSNCALEVNNKVECLMCEFALHQLQTILQDNKTEAAIKSALERVCSLFPITITDQCNAFIEQYGSAIFALLAQELDPSIICTQLGLCDSTKVAPVPIDSDKPDKLQLPIDRMLPINKNLEGKEECLYCQYAMELLHTLLAQNGTKDAIVLGLDDICHTLPGTWRNTCDSFVELYADQFLTILQNQDLTQLCTVLSICSGNVGVSMNQHAKMAAEAAVNHTGGNTCSICEVSVELLSKLLNSPKISSEIVKAIEEVCVAAPKTTRAKCESIIEIYGPYFVKMVAQFTNPKFVCQTIHLCDPPMGQVNLLGGKKCTYGPGYWCQSKIHAKACKAEEHCKKFVWKS